MLSNILFPYIIPSASKNLHFLLTLDPYGKSVLLLIELTKWKPLRCITCVFFLKFLLKI